MHAVHSSSLSASTRSLRHARYQHRDQKQLSLLQSTSRSNAGAFSVSTSSSSSPLRRRRRDNVDAVLSSSSTSSSLVRPSFVARARRDYDDEDEDYDVELDGEGFFGVSERERLKAREIEKRTSKKKRQFGMRATEGRALFSTSSSSSYPPLSLPQTNNETLKKKIPVPVPGALPRVGAPLPPPRRRLRRRLRRCPGLRVAVDRRRGRPPRRRPRRALPGEVSAGVLGDDWVRGVGPADRFESYGSGGGEWWWREARRRRRWEARQG